jgi:hypothetical protein
MDDDTGDHRVFDHIRKVSGMKCVPIVHRLDWSSM